MSVPAVDPTWQLEVSPVRSGLRELLSTRLPVQACNRSWRYLVQRSAQRDLGKITHMDTSGRPADHSPVRRGLGQATLSVGQNKMKMPPRQILHCNAGESAARLLAATLSWAIWTDTAAASQAVKVPAPSPHKLERITEFFNNEIASGKLPGAVVLIQQHGKPVYLKCFGVQDVATELPMTSDTIFALHSMTKPITSVAAMMLVDAGKLSPADPVSKFIPGFSDTKVGIGSDVLKLVPADRPVTVMDLLRHTSGITYDYIGGRLIMKAYSESGLFDGRYTNQVFADRIARLPLARQPGTLWRYGHSTDVLGRIIEIVSGQTLYQFEKKKQRIFDPLGMTSTKFVLESADERARMAEPLPSDTILTLAETQRRAHPEWESGGGGLVSSLTDYARFAQMILDGGQFDGKRYL